MKTLTDIAKALTDAAIPDYVTPAEITDLASAIERSISRTEITRVEVDSPERVFELFEDVEEITSLDSADEQDGSMDVWGEFAGEAFRIRLSVATEENGNKLEAIEWAKKEIANDPDGNRESDMEQLEAAYEAITGDSFPNDSDRSNDAEPRGYAMWSEIRSILSI